MRRCFAFASLFFTLFFLQTALAEELTQVSAAIHIASSVSDGKYSIAELASIAKSNDIKVLVITDHALMRWQYGLWPLQNVVKKTVEQKSVFSYGIRHYLEEMKKAQALNQDIVLIPGVETAPFYYWTGNVFRQDLTIHNWHKHLLVIGLGKERDYAGLPVIGNEGGLFIFSVFTSIATVLFGLFLLSRRRRRVFGAIILIAGSLFFFHGFPFRNAAFDQYHGDKGIAPYQNLIDYAGQKGALTFWSHPEAQYVSTENGIRIETPGYASDLEYADKYTGFAVFHEGYATLGFPGGLWDNILNEYCDGRRKSPVWAMAGLSFESEGDLASALQNLRTVLLVQRLNLSEALKALKTGRMYALRGKLSGQFMLDSFLVRGQDQNTSKTMGEELTTGEAPLIEISGHFSGKEDEALKIKLIKRGKLIQTFEARAPFHIFYTDEIEKKSGRTYYRVEIESPSLTLVSNPVFVQFR
jgi:hypothetical protein